MRLALALVLVLTGPTMSQTELPPADELPARPEMPDPLTAQGGQRISSREQWFNQRRPELRKLFQHYMYGEIPPPVPVHAKIERTDAKALGGKATLCEVSLAVGSKDTPPLHLLLVVPNERPGPAPVFVGLNFSGNHALLDDPAIRLPTAWMYPARKGVKDNKATDAGRGAEVDTWSLAQSIDRGYAVATLYNGDIDPDVKEKRGGLRPHMAKSEGDHGTATIAAWAWGLHRVIDYLVTRKDLDAKRIIVVGHSRLGKTALLAAAFDDRIALAIPHQAGCGGTAPSRGTVGESVARINGSFPHWFCGAFKQFNGRPERLPFDQHCLVALVAPRPVLFTNAVEDTWANPDGQFEVLQAADPVYRFLDAGGLKAKKRPEVGVLSDGTLGYFVRPGKHSMTKDDWKVFLDYADKHLGKPGKGK